MDIQHSGLIFDDHGHNRIDLITYDALYTDIPCSHYDNVSHTMWVISTEPILQSWNLEKHLNDSF